MNRHRYSADNLNIVGIEIETKREFLKRGRKINSYSYKEHILKRGKNQYKERFLKDGRIDI